MKVRSSGSYLLVLLLASVTRLCGQTSTIYALSLGGHTAITAYKPDGTPLPFNVGQGGCSCTGIAVTADGQVIESASIPMDQLRMFNPDGSGRPIVHLGAMFFGVAASDDGRIFALSVDQPGDGVVNILMPNGKPAAASFPAHQTAARIAVSRDGKRIYVSSATGNNVKVFDPQGNQIVKTFGDGISVPMGIAVGPDGKIYVAGQIKATVYDPDGKKLPVEFKRDNDGVPYLPNSVAVDSSGFVYVGYAKGGVGVFNPTGSFVRMVKAPDQIAGVAVH